MSVRIQLLGTGDALGNGGRFQTCFHLEVGGDSLLLDCGASSLIALKRIGIDTSSIGLILLTHLHGDHFGGLPFLLLDGQFSHRKLPLLVAGPPGTDRRVADAMEVFFPGSTTVDRAFSVEFIEYPARESVTMGVAHVTAYPVSHESGAPAFALRVEAEGRTITYSGDCEWDDALVEASRGADLFICEAYSFEKQIRNHLDHATLANHREALECKRVLLTHMGPEMLALRSRSQFESAHDGMSIEL